MNMSVYSYMANGELFIAILTLQEKEDRHRKEASTQKEKRSFGLKIRRKPKTDN